VASAQERAGALVQGTRAPALQSGAPFPGPAPGRGGQQSKGALARGTLQHHNR
jgi:hypothetical protein